ncbi:caspase domain-containing protein [Streptomyces sp. NPDC058872]|uniref:caspase family protein n=1 Tax=Streptomyces sp. NPDC058872 TaxID=3346661 RepID=UPI0036A11C63
MLEGDSMGLQGELVKLYAAANTPGFSVLAKKLSVDRETVAAWMKGDLSEPDRMMEFIHLLSELSGCSSLPAMRELRELQTRSESREEPPLGSLLEWKFGAAILVGVHSYAHLGNRPAISNNLARMRDILTSPVVGIPEDRCIVLENPTDARTILEILDETARSNPSSLFFYYAGHGTPHPTTGRLLLSLSNSRPHAYYTYLKFDDLREQIAESGVGRRLVVLDSCYSGSGLDSLATFDSGLMAIKGSYVMASSGATEESLAPQGSTYTTFTGEFLRLLEDGVPGGPQVLDADSLFEAIVKSCRDNDYPVPERQARNDGSRIPLTINRSFDASAYASRAKPEKRLATSHLGSKSMDWIQRRIYGMFVKLLWAGILATTAVFLTLYLTGVLSGWDAGAIGFGVNCFIFTLWKSLRSIPIHQFTTPLIEGREERRRNRE